MKNIYSLVAFMVIFLSSDIKAKQWDFKKELLAKIKQLPIREHPYQTTIPAHALSFVFLYQ